MTAGYKGVFEAIRCIVAHVQEKGEPTLGARVWQALLFIFMTSEGVLLSLDQELIYLMNDIFLYFYCMFIQFSHVSCIANVDLLTALKVCCLYLHRLV